MTPPQVVLLKRLINADRLYWRRLVAGETAATLDSRGVEVGWINGISPRTAHTLAEINLVEVLDLPDGNTYAFLGTYSVEEHIEEKP